MSRIFQFKRVKINATGSEKRVLSNFFPNSYIRSLTMVFNLFNF